LQIVVDNIYLHSFPTRRSSDLIEDIAKEQIENGINQYVLLGAGLDSFAQRNEKICSQVDIYEIDQPDTLAWKKERLIENGYNIRSEEHTSELQSRFDIVCRLLL